MIHQIVDYHFDKVVGGDMEAVTQEILQGVQEALRFVTLFNFIITVTVRNNASCSGKRGRNMRPSRTSRCSPTRST